MLSEQQGIMGYIEENQMIVKYPPVSVVNNRQATD